MATSTTAKTVKKDKKKIELMKVIYAERDLREKAKRTINE